MLEGNDRNIHHGDTEAPRTDEPLAQSPEPPKAQTRTEEIRETQPRAAGPHEHGDEPLEVVTEDYKTVKLAWHQMFNLKERIRKQMGLPEDWRTDEAKILYYRQQLALLEKADAAPRCEHIRADGTRCRGPRLRGGKKCYAHTRMEAARPQTLQLPALEDANSVLLAVMEIQRALLDGLISEKTAGLLLYSVQIGACAVRHATFAETEPEEMVRTAPALSRQHSALSQNRGQIHRGDAEARRTEERLAKTKSFTTEGAEDAGEKAAYRGLTRMNADDSGAEEQLANGNWQKQYPAASTQPKARADSPRRRGGEEKETEATGGGASIPSSEALTATRFFHQPRSSSAAEGGCGPRCIGDIIPGDEWCKSNDFGDEAWGGREKDIG